MGLFKHQSVPQLNSARSAPPPQFIPNSRAAVPESPCRLQSHERGTPFMACTYKNVMKAAITVAVATTPASFSRIELPAH